MRFALLTFVQLALLGCGGSTSVPPKDAGSDGGTTTMMSDMTGAPADAMPAACHATPAPADRARKVVVSHPFSNTGNGTSYEVLDLSATGELSRTGAKFDMMQSADRPLRFTPDGRIGMLAQNDGSLGVFRFDDAGAVVVVHIGFHPGFYATDVTVAPDAAHVWVVDADTVANGGGLYRLDMACDGTLSNPQRLMADNANALAFLDGTRAVASVKSLLGEPASADTALVDLSAMSLVASGNAFGDGMAIPSSLALTLDGRYALITDDGLDAGNRMAVVSLPQLNMVQLLMTPNPAQVAMSPYGNAALLLNSNGTDAERVVSYDASNATAPFAIVGPVAYKNGKPQLPAAVDVIARGMLEGRALVAENVAVRSLQFHPDGTVDDVGILSFGTDNPSIVGTLGVQP